MMYVIRQVKDSVQSSLYWKHWEDSTLITMTTVTTPSWVQSSTTSTLTKVLLTKLWGDHWTYSCPYKNCRWLSLIRKNTAPGKAGKALCATLHGEMLLDFSDKKFNIKKIYPKSLRVNTSRGIAFWSNTQAAYAMIPKSYFLTLLHVCRFTLQHTILWMEPHVYFPRSLASFVPSSRYKARLWGHNSKNPALSTYQPAREELATLG